MTIVRSNIRDGRGIRNKRGEEIKVRKDKRLFLESQEIHQYVWVIPHFFCDVHCNIITQYKPTKCAFPKLIFLIFNLFISSAFFEPEGSSSGI